MMRINPEMSGVSEIKRTSERGIALVICIGFLALLSIIGVTLMKITEGGILQSRKSKDSKNTFLIADSGVEVSMDSTLGSTGAVSLDSGKSQDLTAYVNDFIADIGLDPGVDIVDASLTFVAQSSSMPANAPKYDSSISAANAKVYRYFHISLETRDSDKPNIRPVRIDALMAQAFPALTGIPVEVASGKMDAPDSGGN